MSYGIRYVVIAIGAPDDPCDEELAKSACDDINKLIPYNAIVLPEKSCDRLTAGMLLDATIDDFDRHIKEAGPPLVGWEKDIDCI